MFGELSICGYPPRDFLDYDEFVQMSNDSIEEILKHTEDIAVIIGAPTNNQNNSGKRLRNSALFLYEHSFYLRR